MPQLEVQRGDTTLLVKTQGPRKGPTLLFLHAGGESLPAWSPLFSHLRPQHWQLAAPNLHGQGESAQLRDYAYDEFLGDAQQIIRSLKGRPLVLVGSSSGALMALMLSMHYPCLIDGLVLLDAPSGVSTEAAKLSHAFTEGRSGDANPLTQMNQGPVSALLLDKALLDPLRLAQAAQSVSVPTLFLYGSHSERVGEKELRRLRRDIPHVEMEEIKAGHLIARDNPQAVADKIAAFIPTLIVETIH